MKPAQLGIGPTPAVEPLPQSADAAGDDTFALALGAAMNTPMTPHPQPFPVLLPGFGPSPDMSPVAPGAPAPSPVDQPSRMEPVGPDRIIVHELPPMVPAPVTAWGSEPDATGDSTDLETVSVPLPTGHEDTGSGADASEAAADVVAEPAAEPAGERPALPPVVQAAYAVLVRGTAAGNDAVAPNAGGHGERAVRQNPTPLPANGGTPGTAAGPAGADGATVPGALANLIVGLELRSRSTDAAPAAPAPADDLPDPVADDAERPFTPMPLLRKAANAETRGAGEHRGAPLEALVMSNQAEERTATRHTGEPTAYGFTHPTPRGSTGIEAGSVIETAPAPAPDIPERPPASADRVTVQLPDEAGGARVRIAVRGEVVHASIVAADAAALQALEGGITDLRDALARQGFHESHVRIEPRPAAASQERRESDTSNQGHRPEPRDQRQGRSPQRDRRERER